MPYQVKASDFKKINRCIVRLPFTDIRGNDVYVVGYPDGLRADAASIYYVLDVDLPTSMASVGVRCHVFADLLDVGQSWSRVNEVISVTLSTGRVISQSVSTTQNEYVTLEDVVEDLNEHLANPDGDHDLNSLIAEIVMMIGQEDDPLTKED